MNKLLIPVFFFLALLSSCSDTNELPPDIDGTTWDLYTFLDPPGIPASSDITFNANGTATTVPAISGVTWTLSERDITIKVSSNVQYKGQLKNQDTLMGGTIYKGGSPNGFWSAEKK